MFHSVKRAKVCEEFCSNFEGKLDTSRDYDGRWEKKRFKSTCLISKANHFFACRANALLIHTPSSVKQRRKNSSGTQNVADTPPHPPT